MHHASGVARLLVYQKAQAESTEVQGLIALVEGELDGSGQLNGFTRFITSGDQASYLGYLADGTPDGKGVRFRDFELEGIGAWTQGELTNAVNFASFDPADTTEWVDNSAAEEEAY